MHDDHKGNESSSIKLTYYIWWDNYVEADEISYDKAHIRRLNTGVPC